MKKHAASLLVLAAVGCGAGEGDISGKVKFKGEPLTEGVVTFSLNGKQYAGKITPDGMYRIEHVPPGTAKISIWVPHGDASFAMPDDPKFKYNIPGGLPPEARKAFEGVKAKTKKTEGDKETAKKLVPKLPKKYVDPDQSGLQYEVKPGSQTKDLDLTP